MVSIYVVAGVIVEVNVFGVEGRNFPARQQQPTLLYIYKTLKQLRVSCNLGTYNFLLLLLLLLLLLILRILRIIEEQVLPQ